MNKESVRRAVDTALGSRTFTGAQARAVLERTQEETHVKKKMPAALAFALALMLLAASAVAAALLSGKSFVKEIMAPMALENRNEKWTREEVARIIAQGKEHGLFLDEAEEARILSMEEGYYKEELMRRFAKLELGFYPAAWSLEDQVWYDKLLYDCGLLEDIGRTWFMPGPDDLTQEEALAIVEKYVREHYDPGAALGDAQVYLRFMTYRAENERAPRKWGIEFMALDLTHDSYAFTLAQDGTVESAQVIRGVGTAENPAQPFEIYDRYQQVYGALDDWEMETWVSFQQCVANALQAHPESQSPRVLDYIARQTYAIPGADMLTREAAVEAAVQALMTAQGAGESALDREYAFGICLLDGQTPVWRVSVPGAREDGRMSETLYLLELDARTGEVRGSAVHEGYDDRNIMRYVLTSVYEEVKQSEPVMPEGGWG